MLLSLAVGLAAILVTAKFMLLPFEVHGVGEFFRYCLRLALVCAADVFFVVMFTATMGLIGYFAVRSKWTAWPWRIATLIIFQAAGLYTVVAVRVFEKTTEMISIRMISFMGEPEVMASSFERYLTTKMVILFAVIGGTLLFVPLLGRKFASTRFVPTLGWKTVTAGLLLTVAYGGVSQAYINAKWDDPNRWELRISNNPQATLALSCVEQLINGDSFLLADDFGAVDESDFKAGSNVTIDFPEGVQRPKNVFMIVMESVGAEYLDLYGSKHQTMPNLTKAAQENGVVFENFYIQVPYSCKSLVALTTSVYPRIDWGLIARDNPNLPIPTVGEQLVNQGYRAAFMHSGFWSWKYRDRFFGRDERVKLIDANTLPGPYVNSWGKSDTAMYEAALDWMEHGGEEPFFLFAFTIETHHPYSSDEHYPFEVGAEQDELYRYLNAIREADAKIGWLLNELKARGLDESTMVVVTSDHGEAFGQHGQWIHGFGAYQPNMEVPLVMLHPSLKHLPRRVSGVRQQIDVPPTITSLLGKESFPGWQGKNLFRADEANDRAYFFSLGGRSVLGLRDKNLKYMYYVNTGHEQLFDVEADPGEMNNLAAQNRDLCQSYRRRVGGFVGYQRNFLKELGAR